MDTDYVNCMVYDYISTVDTKLAKKFKKEAKMTEQFPPGSPVFGDVVKHFCETSSKEMKRKIEISDEKSTPVKKSKKNLIPDTNAPSDKEMDEKECETDNIEVKATAHNKQIKIDEPARKPRGKPVPVERTKVFIRNIGKEFAYEDFQDKVDKFGEVADFLNPGRGFCFLTFSSTEAAKDCIAALNNTEIAGKVVQMNIAREKPETNAAGKDTSDNAEGCKLFVHGVKQETDSEELKAAFEIYGKVSDSFNPGKGFAFVTFSTPEEATAAVEALNGKDVCGNLVSVNVSKPKVKPEADNTGKEGGKAGKSKKKEVLEGIRLFVNNVGEDTSQEDLKTAFAAHGTVTDAYNPGKGFAFVNFATEDEAQAAIEALNGKEVCGREVECNIAKFKKKVIKGKGRS